MTNKKQPIATDTAQSEKAVLVSILLPGQTEETMNEHLDELDFLAETAGATVIKRFYQRLNHPDPGTFVKSGKLEEIAEYVKAAEVGLVIFDDDLSGTQIKNVEKAVNCKALDRSHLILDIFALRAKTAQARAQVELAQMQYLLPRLRGMWTHLERQRGGIGLRGPGEKEIETDRRVVKDKIARLKEQLEKIDRQAQTQRKTRGELIRVALVGYTNAGKSTLMNTLAKAEVFAENKLFATLDTTVRKVVIETTPFLLSDTVGFIRKLPHHLVESFKSTLDETLEADILLHVVDLSHPHFEDHIRVVDETLRDIGATESVRYLVFNKMDAYRDKVFDPYLPEETKKSLEEQLIQSWQAKTENRSLFVSALTGENMAELRSVLLQEVKRLYKERYPYRTEFF